MPSASAAFCALARSREAIAVTKVRSPFCIPGITFLRPILAVLSTPQRTFPEGAFPERTVIVMRPILIESHWPVPLWYMLGLRGGVCFVLLDHFLWAEAPRGKPSAIAGAESTLPNAALARALARSLTVDLEIGA